MGKYASFGRYLNSLATEAWPVTFREIEEILGFRLPDSAYTQRAWWSNNPSNSVMTKVWREAGWKTEQVDMEGRRLVFRREKGPRYHGDPHDSRSGAVAKSGSQDLRIRGLDNHTLAKLAAKADASDRTIEEVARDILVSGSNLNPEERVALFAKMRARMPDLGDVDVSALVREGRDDQWL